MRPEECWYLGVCPKSPSGCSNTCLRYSEMLSLVQQSNIPSSKWIPLKLRPGKDRPAFIRLQEIKDDIENWTKSGGNLYIYSDTFGNGKTSWAIKLMLAYFNQVWAGNGFRRRGIFVSVPEFMDRNREIINNRDEEFVKMREDLLKCDLVIWDDITSIKLTDFNHAVLLNYIDARVLSNKANIFTGNVDYEGMVKNLGGRLASRVWNGSEIVQFVDQDKRGVYYD
jgi:DNA replication protein DnaC